MTNIIFEVVAPLLRGLVLIICVIVGVAFLTLLERKVLGYVQIRRGPNKVGFTGVFQPFNDAIKLFTKEQIRPLVSNYLVYYLSPVFSLFLSLFCWMCLPLLRKTYSFNLGSLFFLCCLRMGVYSVMLAGWSSNSNYALLGGLRSVAQTISYEVSLALIFISPIFLVGGYNFFYYLLFQDYVWFIFTCFPIILVWFCTSLAETNRTPFDFAEGESELVSGFNVEYRRGGFALIFLAEYARILFIRMLFSVLFLGGEIYRAGFYFKLTLVSFCFIWIRGTIPRFRYDKLIDLSWKIFLPFSLNFLAFIIGLKVFILCLL